MHLSSCKKNIFEMFSIAWVSSRSKRCNSRPNKQKTGAVCCAVTRDRMANL